MAPRTWSKGMGRCRFLALLASALWLTVVAIPAFAQLSTGTILGTVGDRTGALIPGATVTVRNEGTGLTRTTTSNEEGSYRFSALPVGTYEIRIEQAGFTTEVRSGLTLTVGQEAVLNFALQVGATDSMSLAKTSVTSLIEIIGPPFKTSAICFRMSNAKGPAYREFFAEGSAYQLI